MPDLDLADLDQWVGMYCDVFALLLQRIFIFAMKSLSGGGLVLPYSSFIPNYGHLHLGCRVSYGPLYFSIAMVDENTFYFTLGIPVFPHTATQCCRMDPAFSHLQIKKK